MAVVTVRYAGPSRDFASMVEDLQHLPGDAEFPGGILQRTAELYVADYGYGGTYRLFGAGLTYDTEGKFSGGTITGWNLEWNGEKDLLYTITGLAVPAVALRDAGGGADVDHPVDPRSFNLAPILFAGDDSVTGAAGDGDFAGYDGNDIILAAGGADTVAGNVGADTLDGGSGDDLLHGGKGDDVLVGGDGADQALGERGDDMIQANRGNDTLDGGEGADSLRGGQGDDLLFGGDGNDLLAGDLGDDSLTGGAGADIFGASDGGGFDRIIDFNPAEGDRVQVAPGSQYKVSAFGADTAISFASGNVVVLVGVTRAQLGDGWIVEA
jgi:Ca2+-binding RTX toxin-like protein